MAIDREKLRQLSAKSAGKPTGVGALPRGIHRMPGVREWVTLESVALAPVPVKRGERWGIVSPIAVPTKLDDGSDGYMAPWGAVEWTWPGQKLAQTTDLRLREEIASLRECETFTARPADKNVTLNPVERTRRENALFLALDEFLSGSGGDSAGLGNLAGHYAGLLPTEVYPYYWALIPSCREWLRPDVPAPALPSSPETEGMPVPENDEQPHPPTPSPQAGRGSLREFESGGKVPENTGAVEESHLPNQDSAPSDNPSVGDGTATPGDATDLSASVAAPQELRTGPWLRRCLQLAESIPPAPVEKGGLRGDIIAQLQALEARQRTPGFRLAFLGEFSRGKSFLINRLLGRELLPVAAPPTTATLTSIVAGTQEQMEVTFSKQRQEVRPLQESSWDDLLATDRVGSDREVLAGVRITLDNPWLRELDVEVIDTPGAGDLNGRRAALVFDLLSQCDAAVLLVSATLPFSMTEAAFLEQEVMGRHVPRILAAVSKLDTIDLEERESVISAIRQRVGKISPAIPVLPAHPVDAITTEEEALSTVRSQIAAMVAKGDRRAWRSRQIAAQLADCLSQMVKVGEGAIAAALGSAAERERALRKAQEELRTAQLEWEQLRLELERRRLLRERQLRLKIMESKQDLVERLAFELSRAPQPKTWWERDLPFQMRRELMALSRQLENLLLKALAEDFEWLQGEINRTFATQIQKKAAPTQERSEIQPEFRQISLTNTQRYRVLTRLGSSAATICGYVLSGPVGIVLSTGVWLLGEQIINKEVEAQRRLLSEELEITVGKALDEYCTQISLRERQLYSQLGEDTKREESIWQSTKNAAFQTDGTGSNEKVWQELIQGATDLRQEILAAW